MASDMTAADVREWLASTENVKQYGSHTTEIAVDDLISLCRLALAVLEAGKGVNVKKGMRLLAKIENRPDGSVKEDDLYAWHDWAAMNADKMLTELGRLRAENAELRGRNNG